MDQLLHGQDRAIFGDLAYGWRTIGSTVGPLALLTESIAAPAWDRTLTEWRKTIDRARSRQRAHAFHIVKNLWALPGCANAAFTRTRCAC